MSGPTATDVLLSARLAGDQSRRVFRAVLEALSRPGTIVALPAGAATGVPPSVVPVLALADLDVSVATLEPAGGTSWASSMRAVTGCIVAALDDADMVVATRPPTGHEVRALRRGTALAPERGARLFVPCTGLDAGSSRNGTTVRIEGPGASAGRTVTVGGVDPEVFQALAAVNEAFPAGVDSWFVTADRRMTAISRSSRVAVVAEHEGVR